MKHDCIAFHKHRLEGLDAHSMKCGSSVEQNGVLVNDLFEDVPDLLVKALDHSFGAFDRVGEAVLLELSDNEGLIQLEGYFLRQAALIEFEVGSYDNHRASRVVHALSEQVFTESALLAFYHIGQRLQRAIVAAQHRSSA